MDRETRYLLVSTVTESRDLSDAHRVFTEARAQADGATPRVVVTDGFPAYMDAAKKVFGSGTRREARHVRDIHLTNHSKNNNLVERLNGTVRGRHSSVRGLKSPSGPLTAGQAAYYNLIRSHQSLGGRTPADAAGVGPMSKNRWLEPLRRADRAIP